MIQGPPKAVAPTGEGVFLHSWAWSQAGGRSHWLPNVTQGRGQGLSSSSPCSRLQPLHMGGICRFRAHVFMKKDLFKSAHQHFPPRYRIARA